jgi:hypothetical protein
MGGRVDKEWLSRRQIIYFSYGLKMCAPGVVKNLKIVVALAPVVRVRADFAV